MLQNRSIWMEGHNLKIMSTLNKEYTFEQEKSFNYLGAILIERSEE